MTTFFFILAFVSVLSGFAPAAGVVQILFVALVIVAVVEKWSLPKLIMLLGPLAAIILCIIVNRVGFCTSTFRFTPDQTFFDGAIKAAIKNEVTRKKNAELIPYPDVETFKRENPACCHVITVTDQLWPPSFMATIKSRASRMVEVNFKQQYREGGLEKTQSSTLEFLLDTCGTVTAGGGSLLPTMTFNLGRR